MPGHPSSGMPTRKRRKKQGIPSVPPLPPRVADNDVDISDEDVEFVRKHKAYAGFLAKLDTTTITRQVLGLAPSQNEDDLETYYEKGTTRGTDFTNQFSVDPVDVLPVKTLTGDLHYRSTSTEDAVDGSFVSLEERRSLVRKPTNKHPSKEVETEDVQKSLQGVGDQVKEDRKTASKRRKGSKHGKQSTMFQEEEEKQEVSAGEDVQSDPEQDLDRGPNLKVRMAEICTGLLADPDGNIMTLKELQDMCLDRDESISQLALLSSMAIFKDLIPGYRIRLPTEKELEMKVSKEVQDLRNFEVALLRFYQAYVQVLVKSAKVRSVRRTALRCLCGLLEAVPHFNYRDSILSAVVPRMNSDDEECSKMCCGAVGGLFKAPAKHGGEATVEAVQLIAEFVRLRNGHLRPEVVEVLLALSFDDDLLGDPGSGAADNPSLEGDQKHVKKMSKRQEKKGKKAQKAELASELRKEVKADFRKASAMQDLSTRRKLQTLTLSSLFETYFRILKISMEPLPRRACTVTQTAESCEERGSGPIPLLWSCLEGLAKFAHLINVDFMADLLEALRTLARGGQCSPGSSHTTVTVWERLQCCTVAFKIARKNMDALNIDLQEFYVLFYSLLFEAISIRQDGGETLAQALQTMLWEGWHSDMNRVTAFLKRLSTLSLSLRSGEAMAVLRTVQHLLVRYKKCRSVVENDGEVGGPGSRISIFRPEGEDPDLSEPQSTVLWELSLLAQHYHPEVSKYASILTNINKSSSMVLPTATPMAAVREFSSILPSVRVPPKFRWKKQAHSRKPPPSMFLEGLLVPSTERPSENMFRDHFKQMKVRRKERKTIVH